MTRMDFADLLGRVAYHRRMANRLDEILASKEPVAQATLSLALPRLEQDLKLAEYGGGLWVDYLTVEASTYEAARQQVTEAKETLLRLCRTERHRLGQLAGKKLQAALAELDASLAAQRHGQADRARQVRASREPLPF